jgi:acetolactate synthase-1/2/3 large subunit
MELTGAQILVECLTEQGVDTVFGYPGGAVLHIYDELYKQSSKIRHILTCHEQGAAHAADGYSRSTGRVGVCIATSGPGATNLVTGIANAYMDSIPMVAITGNVPLPLLGKDSFQEIDIAGVTVPVTKHNYIVKDVNELADVIREAFYIADEGRPGPVLIDIPKDVTAHKAEYTYQKPRDIELHIEQITVKDLDTAIEMIKAAKKPYIFAGGGIVLGHARDEAVEFAEKIQAPVTCSLMAMGGFPGDHPLYTGMIGMHGTKASNVGVMGCDLLIALGARFSDRVIGKASSFAKGAKILHIDIDPAEINKNVMTDHHIIGDLKVVLGQLNKKLERLSHDEWLKEVDDILKKYPLSHGEGLTAQLVVESVYNATHGDAIIATEVGQHQMWAAQFYKFKREGQFLTSGGLGTMGYGLGAAIGAQVGNPDQTVINIAGDGSFRMNLNEIMTAVKYKLPVVIVVINNGVLGMVRQWQTIFYDKRYSFTTLDSELNYTKLAEAFGAVCYEVTDASEVESTIVKAIAGKRTTIVNCIIHEDAMVYPMVAPGAAIDDLIMGDEEE